MAGLTETAVQRVIVIQVMQIRGGDSMVIYSKPEIVTFNKEELANYIMAAACSNGFTCGCNSGNNNMGNTSTCNCHGGSQNTGS